MPILPIDQTERRYMVFALRIVGDFGAAIAVPVVVFVLVGRWLEGLYGGEPWVTIGSFILAAVVSGIYIYKKAKAYGKEYNNIEKEQ